MWLGFAELAIALFIVWLAMRSLQETITLSRRFLIGQMCKVGALGWEEYAGRRNEIDGGLETEE